MTIYYNGGGMNGLTSATAARSAREIKKFFPNSASGKYWVVNPNVNSGAAFEVYCDMETDGGGWMLLVQNATIGGATKLNYTNYSSSSPTTPPTASARANVTFSYSILGWADWFKNSNKPFQYMIDAYERGRYGGIWTANSASYTFNQTVNTATDITLVTKFDGWAYGDSSIEARMPWVESAATTNGKLTTSTSSSSNWWGTLIEADSVYSPAPWIAGNTTGGVTGTTDSPGVIWYWMRSL